MAHGSSPAAWSAVLLCLAGITVAGISLIPTPHWTIFWIGVGLVVISGIVGRVMAAAGMGVDKNSHH